MESLEKNGELRSLVGSLKRSLRVRFALGVMLPILLILIGLSLMHYWRERQLLQEQVRLTGLQLGEVMRGSLHHAMRINDRTMLAETLADVGQMENVRQVQLLDLDGYVRVHSHSEQVGRIYRLEDAGCEECHRFPAEARPHTTQLIVSADTLRIATPIDNGPDCTGCHTEEGSHLGVLLSDVSFLDVERRLLHELGSELLLTAAITLGLVAAVQSVHLAVARRKMAFREPLSRLAAGDFSVRVSARSGPLDELEQVSKVFNQMAAELERRERELLERQAVREQAIADERARIARDLHDGLGQLLGFVNTKAMAARLMLKKQELAGADQNLYQLEEAARELFTDVREAILNLRTASPHRDGLRAELDSFVSQFGQLAGVPVELAIAPEVGRLALDGQTERHLLRIIQEALNNIRKHASATRAWVRLQATAGVLQLIVGDDGRGFDPARIASNPVSGVGLHTMQERAKEMRAEFVVDTRPGGGTQVIVRLPLQPLPPGAEKEN